MKTVVSSWSCMPPVVSCNPLSLASNPRSHAHSLPQAPEGCRVTSRYQRSLQGTISVVLNDDCDLNCMFMKLTDTI